jgi:hypothetical protein
LDDNLIYSNEYFLADILTRLKSEVLSEKLKN